MSMPENDLARREFLKKNVAAGIGLTLGSSGALNTPAAVIDSEDGAGHESNLVRVGIIGTGHRGNSLMGILLQMDGVTIPALCDIVPERVRAAQEKVTAAGQKAPDIYDRGPEDYKRLLDRNDLDAVIIATPWQDHAPMAVYSMNAGKYVGLEVPAALTVEECWELVDTCEQTGVPCMMLENWSHRRDNLAVLNMIRKGMLGQIVHCHCAHSHNCVYWYFGKRAFWARPLLETRNADPYPTHSLGPVVSWMDINCGDQFDYLTSMSTASLGINMQLAKKEDYGPNHPATKMKYAQGDIVTTMIKTIKGKTIVLANDMQLPRPYDNRWLIQGTKGRYNEQRNAVYLDGISPNHEKWESFPPYQDKYDHSWYRDFDRNMNASEQLKNGHGGTDYIELTGFIKAVREKTQTPIDIYDSVAFSVIIPLTAESLAKGSTPVKCPDFTRGRWKTRGPSFAVEKS